MGRNYCGIPYTADLQNGPRLDVFLPEEGEGPFPLVVCPQLEEGNGESGERMLEGGYAVAKVRLSALSQAHFPAQMKECRCALRFLRAHSQSFFLDREPFLLWGAGLDAYLCAMLALTMGSAEFDDLTLGYPNEPDSVQAAVLKDGVYDLSGLLRRDGAGAQAFLEKLFGTAKNETSFEHYDPLHLVSPDAPPVFLLLSADAPAETANQSETFHQALRRAIGEQCALHSLPAGQRGWFTAVGEIYAFLARYLP